jgi:DDE superfamily endonuclease
LKPHWCLAKVGADFVWHMADVLDLYAQPYDATHPQVCVDERPCQLLTDSREPMAPQPGQVARQDYEYVRHGTCNRFRVFEPHTGWRETSVPAHRQADDFASLLRDLGDGQFPTAEKIRGVQDKLNIHSPASLYASFEPAAARRILRKLEFHYTPKHASWLNMVEIELSVLSRQCLGQRMGDMATLQREVSAWRDRRNAQHATVHWQFSVQKARSKLSRLYPSTPVC